MSGSDIERGSRTGARWGVLFGCTSWIVVLGVVCAATGRTQHLLPAIVPLLLASIGLGLLVLLCVEPMFAAQPGERARLRRCVLGAVLVVAGILALLAEAFVVPILDRDRPLGDVVRAAGGVLALSRAVSVALLLCGCAILGFGMQRRNGAA